jgi:hypothetical protein
MRALGSGLAAVNGGKRGGCHRRGRSRRLRCGRPVSAPAWSLIRSGELDGSSVTRGSMSLVSSHPPGSGSVNATTRVTVSDSRERASEADERAPRMRESAGHAADPGRES